MTKTPRTDSAHLTRRRLLLGGAAVSAMALSAFGGRLRRAQAATDDKAACGKYVITEDGLHMQPWFIQDSFLDLNEELKTAKKQGKWFVVVVEQKGCPYCAKMHEKILVRPEVCDYLRKNFAILQINLKGLREVTDFDGETLSERDWCRKYMAFTTPYILFFDMEDPENLGKRTPQMRIVHRLPGLIAATPADFLKAFKYVTSGAYKKVPFLQYMRQKG